MDKDVLASISSLCTAVSFLSFHFRCAVLGDRCSMGNCDIVDRCTGRSYYTYDASKCRQVSCL